MIYRRIALCILFIGISFCCSVHAGVYDNLQKKELEELAEQRGSATGIVRLYEARQLEYRAAEKGLYKKALEETISSSDSSPEVAALATFQLIGILRNRGDFTKAEKLEAGLGFVDSWRIIGPFEDENKSGYDIAYPPEQKFAYEGSYMGKDHQVKWRDVPVRVAMGYVPLEQLVDPSVKTTAYAFALVKVNKTVPCVIRGGYNEAYKLWVNGEKVGGHKNYIGYAFDEYAEACTLTSGWNVILIKICNQNSIWGFSIRLTDADGRALKGVKVAGNYKEAGEPLDKVLAKNGLPPEKYPFFDPGSVLRKDSESGKALDIENYGLYLTHTLTYDSVNQENLDILRKAASTSDCNAGYWLALADAETDRAKERMDLEKALKCDPENVPVLLGLSAHFVHRGMPYAALPYARKAVKVAGDDPVVQASMAELQSGGYLKGRSCKALEELYVKYPECSFVRDAYISSLKDVGLSERLSGLEKKLLSEKQNESWAWKRVVDDLVESGDVIGALDLYKKMEKRFPLECSIYYQNAKYLLKLDRASEAISVFADVLKWSPDWSAGHELYGDLLQASGDSEAALSEYKSALLLKPQDEDLKRKIAFLGPEKKAFEDEYRIALGDIPSSEGEEGDEQAIVLLMNEVVKVQPNGLASRYVQRVTKVLKRSAVKPMSYYAIPFDPDREEVRVLDAYILKADGRKVHPESGYTDYLSDPSYRMYYRNRSLVLSFPSLEEGDLIWIEYKKSDVGDHNEYGKYFGDLTLFGGGLKILQQSYTLILPRDFHLYMHEEDMGVKPMIMSLVDKDTTVYRWIKRDIPRVKMEPLMPGLTEVVPYLHLSTFNSWDALGSWYAKFIRDQWTLTPEIKDKVRELISGLSSKEEKVEAIHRWVVQNTRYVALEFGVHGYKPYKASKVYTRRFGDCKDKAVLLASMLREAGFDTAITLVRTSNRGSLNPEPASMAIFNHAICYVPELNLFLDGTAEYSALSELPYQDQGVWVQVVWPDGRTKRMKTPSDKVGDDAFHAIYSLEIKKDEMSAGVEANLTMKGQECPRVRSRYQDPDKVVETLQKDLSGSFPSTIISSADMTDPLTLETPVVIKFTGTLGEVAKPDGEDFISLPTWMGALNLSSALGALNKRVYPEIIQYPFSQEYDIFYKLPEGAKPQTLSDIDVTSKFGSVKRTVKVEGSTVILKTEVTVSVTRVDPKDYLDFKAFCLQADRAGQERLRVKVGGGES